MKISNNHISKNRNINDINMMEQIQGNELKKILIIDTQLSHINSTKSINLS